MRNLINALIVATIAASFAMLFWSPVGGAVIPKTETFSAKSSVHLAVQGLAPVW